MMWHRLRGWWGDVRAARAMSPAAQGDVRRLANRIDELRIWHDGLNGRVVDLEADDRIELIGASCADTRAHCFRLSDRITALEDELRKR